MEFEFDEEFNRTMCSLSGNYSNRIFALDEYLIEGKKINWMNLSNMINRAAIHNRLEYNKLINLKFLQEIQRAKDVINAEKNYSLREQMINMYRIGYLYLDYMFFGKPVHE